MLQFAQAEWDGKVEPQNQTARSSDCTRGCMHAEAWPDTDRPVVNRLNRPQAALHEFILDPERVKPAQVAEPTS